MTTKELYDQYMITSMVAGFEPIEVERAQGTTITRQRWQDVPRLLQRHLRRERRPPIIPKSIAAAKRRWTNWSTAAPYIYYNPPAGLLAKRLAEITPANCRKPFLPTAARKPSKARCGWPNNSQARRNSSR